MSRRRSCADVERVLDAPALPESLIRFVDWVADYTLQPRGMVLRMVLRSPEALLPERPVVGVRLSGPPPDRMTEARRRVLDLAEDGLAWAKSALADAAGVSSGVVDGLVSLGTLQIVPMPLQSDRTDPDPDHGRPTLSAEQEHAAAALRDAVGGGFSVALLDGVTGAGRPRFISRLSPRRSGAASRRLFCSRRLR
jgi:primosomal protein N' (replication factor Y)